VVARLVGPHTDALLARGGHGPGVAVPHERAVDPHVEVGAAAVRIHLEAARDLRLWRLDDRAGAEHAPPAERVDDERRGQLAAVRPHDVAARAERSTPSTTAISKRASPHCAHSASHSVR
jgi:hypothetical protein